MPSKGVVSVYRSAKAGFCPHWSAVVGSNHHLASLTTTQLLFNPIYNLGESPFS